MSLINIIVLSFKLLVDCWDVFVYGRGWPHASQVCCDSLVNKGSTPGQHLVLEECYIAYLSICELTNRDADTQTD